MFQNRARREIFEPEWQEVAGDWRKLCIEELNDLYCSPNAVKVTVSSRMRWAGHVARVGEKRNAYRLLVGKTEG